MSVSEFQISEFNANVFTLFGLDNKKCNAMKCDESVLIYDDLLAYIDCIPFTQGLVT